MRTRTAAAALVVAIAPALALAADGPDATIWHRSPRPFTQLKLKLTHGDRWGTPPDCQILTIDLTKPQQIRYEGPNLHGGSLELALTPAELASVKRAFTAAKKTICAKNAGIATQLLPFAEYADDFFTLTSVVGSKTSVFSGDFDSYEYAEPKYATTRELIAVLKSIIKRIAPPNTPDIGPRTPGMTDVFLHD
jgi:hypothetical protein